MIEEKPGLKVAYKGVPTEEEVRTILKKKKRTQLIITILILSAAAAVGWYAFSNKEKFSQPSKQTMPENK